ncbi:uncharacterized protein LOC125667385 isoform X3 [Ostrea edulis]|uniref:uncharacterized protein LOC125667385 isoform X3 n=1 Tax=Ostrea edulis TaxID=37623 RepID=UPI0024AFCF4A|nr:uncharacterized protein LOC125667385 isoform X3 [Ostrea edulis]
MEKLGFQARAPRGVKLSKPPPRKLSTGEICKDERENSEIQELSKLVQNSSTELNNNCLAEDYRLTTGSDPDGLNLCSVCDHSEGIAVVKKRLRAPRMVKLSKPRPLRRIATSKETDSITTCIEVNNNLAQSTKYTSDFFHIGSLEEAEDKILHVIEKLDSLDQTSTELFKDTLIKHGPKLETENPAFIRSCLACIEEFLKRDGADDGVRSVLQQTLDLHRQSKSQRSEKLTINNKKAVEQILEIRKRVWATIPEEFPLHDQDDRRNETVSDATRMLENGGQTKEKEVCRAISVDSGYGDLDDTVLWNSEDSFIQDLYENLKTQHVENLEQDDLGTKATSVLSNQTQEIELGKDSHEFLSKHFGQPTPKEDNQSLYSTESHWSETVRQQNKISEICQGISTESHRSETVRQQNKISEICQGISTEFTKLKDNEMKRYHTRTGFGVINDRTDKWTRGQDEKFSRRTNESRLFPTLNGADQDSWRKPSVCHGFGIPGRISTVSGEDGSDNSTVVHQRPKHLIHKVHFEGGNAKIVVERNPLGPGSDPSLIADVEKGLPKSIYSASGRRRMFKKYNTAVCIEELDSDDLEEVDPIVYSRKELLKLADNPLSKQKPTEASYLCKLFPDVCLNKVEKYFSSADLQEPSEYLFRARKEKYEMMTHNSERPLLPNTSNEFLRNGFQKFRTEI